jgi:hypothetical protein
VGWRFGRDLQGLENWSSKVDVLEELKSYGIELDFDYFPAYNGTAYDAWGKSYEVKSKKPLFYTVERGPSPTSFDSALLRRAQSLGVEVIFNKKIHNLTNQSILATGPKQADAIAVGYQFKTKNANGFWVICDDKIAPKGYAYLLIMNGIGTVKSCQFQDFNNQNLYVERTLNTFKKLLNLEMHELKKHGGAGNFYISQSLYSGINPVIGEQAGFQDFLWGFGMRYAIRSGVMAAQYFHESTIYQKKWQQKLMPLQKASVVNRWFYSVLGNHGYRWALKLGSRKDACQELYKLYNPSLFKKIIYPFASYRVDKKRNAKGCQHIDCDCVWCKHQH